MKNLIGGVIGALVACVVISFMSGIPLSTYPDPFNQIGFILDGPPLLETAYFSFFNARSLVNLLIVIVFSGIVLVLFSKNQGSVVRTILWMGASLGSIHVASVLLMNPAFWTSADRNFALLMIYIQNILISIPTIVASVPLMRFKAWLNRGEVLIPPKIETICECGAVFKSRPMICSECGKTLDYLSTLSTDTATK